MADTVKVFGSNIPKPVAIGGAGIVVIGGVIYYRKQKASQAAQASVAQAGSSEIDPATGYPYGSAEDAAALSAQSNYQSPTQFAGYGFQGYAGGSGGVFGTGSPGSFTSNAEWAQYVEQYEVNNLGADAVTVGNAIGKYITGQPLTTDMVGIVQSAIAIAGYPPVSGPNGYPPSYQTGTQGTTTPPPSGGGTTTPPPSGGGTTTPPAASAPGTVTGLHVTNKSQTAIGLAWNKAPNATQYQVRVTYQSGVIQTHFTTATSFNVTGLAANRTYGLHVVAINGSNWAPEASISQKTNA